MSMSYKRFAAMIATSTVVMFLLMYLNTYALEHVFFSETRLYMAILMGAAMAVIMLGFMLAMYPSKRANAGIFAGSVLVFILALFLVRSQATVDQVSYMRAMIPHHSIAIMTSERAQITDPRVRKLADEIIEAQRREIAEMKYLIAHAEKPAGAPVDAEAGQDGARIAPPEEAVGRAEIATVDLQPMSRAAVEKVVRPDWTQCRFALSKHDLPVLVAALPRESEGGATAHGVIKLHGRLVALRSPASVNKGDLANRVELRADGVAVRVYGLADTNSEAANRPDEGWREADLLFRLRQGLSVGYRGYYGCGNT